MGQSKAARLRAALGGGDIVVAAGVYDMISARIADGMGFSALYMTGYGTVASALGIADAGLASYTEMVERVAVLAGGTATPMICDADTGYGGLLNVRRTVQGYEAAGAAGIQIEDQEMPKKCGHTLGRRVVPLEDMVLKIRVAVEARRDPATLIVARTDCRTTLGIDEALRRGEAFAKAGADVVFIESPESRAELERIGKALSGSAWLLCNMVYDGRTPETPADDLKRMGFSIAIYAGMAHKAAAGALEAAYRHLKVKRTQMDMPGPMYSSAKMHELMGFPEVWAFEKRWDQGQAG
ncbi:MAG: isocitrate lyase/PEP mutase family protein [Alphaproteobacteria bacterium]|nr:isocitrate lyase/PEP mutase family protein [Alphaproteobacteria bacterium]